MLEPGLSPFEGHYARSVLATYRSAVRMQNVIQALVRKFTKDMLRKHDLWCFALVCGVRKLLRGLCP